MKTLLVITVVGLALSTQIHAQLPHHPPGSYATGPYPAPTAYPMRDPRKVVQTGIDKIRMFVESEKLDDAASLQRFVETEVAPFFDFSTMSSLILGHLEYSLDPQQRNAINTMIKQRFLAALVNNLSDYRGGQARLVNVNGNLYRGRVNAIVHVYRQNQYPTAVELRIARIRGEWKIYDVAANGVSAVAHYRNHVHSVVQRSGIQALFTDKMRNQQSDDSN